MSTEQIDKFQDQVDIPEGVTVTIAKHMLSFVGPLGKTHKSFRSIPVNITIAEGKVILKTIYTKKHTILQTKNGTDEQLYELFKTSQHKK